MIDVEFAVKGEIHLQRLAHDDAGMEGKWLGFGSSFLNSHQNTDLACTY